MKFLNVLGEYFISHEKSGHVIQKEDVWQPYLAMLLICDLCKSKADAKSTRNEKRRKLMSTTWLSLAFTRFRYLADFQETKKCLFRHNIK